MKSENTITLNLSKPNESTVNVEYIKRGKWAGRVSFTLTDETGEEKTITLASKEETDRLMSFLVEQTTVSRDVDLSLLFTVKGHAIAIVDRKTMVTADRVPSKSVDDCFVADGDLSYEKLVALFPEYSNPRYIFVYYNLLNFVDDNTVASVIDACLDYQRDFLKDGDLNNLHKMLLEDISAIANVNNSTVSRYSDGACIYSSTGTYTFEKNTCCLETPSLFDDGAIYNGKEISRYPILLKIKELIEENPRISDQSITDTLNAYGYEIERRTVAKYRSEFLHIPSSRER